MHHCMPNIFSCFSIYRWNILWWREDHGCTCQENGGKTTPTWNGWPTDVQKTASMQVVLQDAYTGSPTKMEKILTLKRSDSILYINSQIRPLIYLWLYLINTYDHVLLLCQLTLPPKSREAFDHWPLNRMWQIQCCIGGHLWIAQLVG